MTRCDKERLVQPLSSLKPKYCANCDKSMKLSAVNPYTIKFIFRCGAILDGTRDDLESSMTSDVLNISFSAKCR